MPTPPHPPRSRSSPGDIRRQVPRTDAMLADPRLHAAVDRLGAAIVKDSVRRAQQRVRAGDLAPESVVDVCLADLPDVAGSMRPVINATGVVLHTNIGRAPLSDAAVEAVVAAARYVDLEYDRATGARGRRGQGALAALRARVPAAGDALVLNNGAAALALAATALAQGREIIVSRGELVEIGDGFRLPDLLVSTGAVLREVGTTNRVHLRDYRDAISADTGFILKVHPSNFAMTGFTSSVAVRELARLSVPLVADIGSGLLDPDPALPGEPDAATWLREGATLVTSSGDKLLGGPQAGIVFGDAAVVNRLRRHPLARALRVDKLTLAALEATLLGPPTPTHRALHADPAQLHARAGALAEAIARAGVASRVVPSAGRVGGGGAPAVELSGWAVELAEPFSAELRRGDPCVVGRVAANGCLLDLRCVELADEARILAAVVAAAKRLAQSAAAPGVAGGPTGEPPCT